MGLPETYCQGRDTVLPVRAAGSRPERATSHRQTQKRLHLNAAPVCRHSWSSSSTRTPRRLPCRSPASQPAPDAARQTLRLPNLSSSSPPARNTRPPSSRAPSIIGAAPRPRDAAEQGHSHHTRASPQRPPSSRPSRNEGRQQMQGHQKMTCSRDGLTSTTIIARFPRHDSVRIS